MVRGRGRPARREPGAGEPAAAASARPRDGDHAQPGELLNLVVAETDPRGAAAALRRRSPGLAVVVTLGEDGALVIDDAGETLIDVEPVDAVDTTGAGDCFNGVLAAAIHEGLPIEVAARRAATAAALSVTVAGAREGMPSRAAVDAALAG